MITKLYDWEAAYSGGGDADSVNMINRIRASLQARLEGWNEGGDIEVMRLIDEIVKRESLVDPKDWPKSMRSRDQFGKDRID